jgi:hypothetical protein
MASLPRASRARFALFSATLLIMAGAVGVACSGSSSDESSHTEGALNTAAGDSLESTAKDGGTCRPAIDKFRELEIVHPLVVGDPVRTSNGSREPDGGETAPGHWSIRFLLEQMAPKGVNAGDFFRDLLLSWDSTHQIEKDKLETRDIDGVVLCPWLAASGCSEACDTCKTNGTHLDLTKAPFELLAIVNRLDLHGNDCQSAGEGRFVFGVLNQPPPNDGGTNDGGQVDSGPDDGGGGTDGEPPPQDGGRGDALPPPPDAGAPPPPPPPPPPFGQSQQSPLPFTMIFEYHLPVNGTTLTRLTWATKWHALSTHAIGSSAYNEALQAITDLFASRNADPGLPNGSAISQIRTNEIALSIPWQLREFNMAVNNAGQGFMVPATTKQSMSQTLNNTVFLHDFIVQNAKAINNGTIIIAPNLLGGESNEGVDPWMSRDPSDAGPLDPTTLRNFSQLTCNGCHKDSKTFDDQQSTFYQVSPLLPPGPDGTGRLAKFLTGDLNDAGKAPDGGVGAGDLARRADELQEILCGTSCLSDGGVPLAAENARVE